MMPTFLRRMLQGIAAKLAPADRADPAVQSRAGRYGSVSDRERDDLLFWGYGLHGHW